MKSPAEILRGFLITDGVCIMPPVTHKTIPPVVQPRDGQTLCYVNFLPDEPDQVAVLTDISGVVFGRTQDGQQSIHPGVGIMVRALDARGYDLAEKIAAALQTINRTKVTLDGVDYLIQSAYLAGTIMSMGEEPGKRRRLWKVNYRVAFA